jgi:4-hydroxy-tetrahydrodipicolinate synthase
MPGLTKISYELDTVRQALELPNVIGLKDSSQGMIYFNRVRALTSGRANFRLLVGPEELLAESAMMGGDGGVCGGANLFPRLYVNLYDSARKGDRERAHALHARVLEISGALYSANRATTAMIKGLKCALSCLGICGDFMADPFTRHGPAERERIGKLMDTLKNELY